MLASGQLGIYRLAEENKVMLSALFFIFSIAGPAQADPFSLDALLDDTAAPEPPKPGPNAEWPKSAHIDQVTQQLTITWADKPEEALTMANVLQLEFARAWDQEPAELFAVLQDGRRLALSRGDQVIQQVALMRVWLANRLVELPVGQGHSSGIPKGTPDPQFLLTAAGSQLQLGKMDAQFKANPTEPTESKPEAVRKGSCVNCIDKRDVDRAVKIRMDKIRECYQRELRRQPTLAGELVVSFVVQRDGTVGSASIKKSTINNAAVESCVRAQFFLMKFTVPPGNQTIDVNYPIVFASG